LKTSWPFKLVAGAAVVVLAFFLLHKQLIHPDQHYSHHCAMSDAVFTPTSNIKSFDLITLEHAGCVASCKSYKVVVHRDGKFEFDRHDYRAQENSSGQLSERQINRLLSAVNEAGFFSIPGNLKKEPYKDPETGAVEISGHTPGIYMSVIVQGAKKDFIYGSCAPPKQVETFQGVIDDVVDTDERLWKELPNKAP
jgi:hypothetical protein